MLDCKYIILYFVIVICIFLYAGISEYYIDYHKKYDQNFAVIIDTQIETINSTEPIDGNDHIISYQNLTKCRLKVEYEFYIDDTKHISYFYNNGINDNYVPDINKIREYGKKYQVGKIIRILCNKSNLVDCYINYDYVKQKNIKYFNIMSCMTFIVMLIIVGFYKYND